MPHTRFSVAVTALMVVVGVVAGQRLAAQAAAQGPWPLGEIRVEGASRYPPDQVVALTGLQVGRTVSTADLQAVANELMATGLFARLGFSYAVTAEGNLQLTLRIEEPAWTTPLTFDNVIWMSDEDLTAELARHVPGFDGTAVEGGVANEFIARAAERVLASRGITARMDVEPRLNLTSGATTYNLVVREAATSLVVCDIQFPGAAALSPGALRDFVEPLVGTPYSRSSLTAIVGGSIRQAYRERGHWRATFSPPQVTRASAGCDGLSIAVDVDEGNSYAFAGARWIGPSAIGADMLTRALGLRVGATADGRRLDAGLSAVERLYHERGYLTVGTGVTAEFDDTAGRVAFAIEVREGPQFRMGSLTVEGLDERPTADTTRRWRLKAGDVFNGLYYREFLAEQSRRVGGGLQGNAKLNTEARTVDVTFSAGP